MSIFGFVHPFSVVREYIPGNARRFPIVLYALLVRLVRLLLWSILSENAKKAGKSILTSTSTAKKSVKKTEYLTYPFATPPS